MLPHFVNSSTSQISHFRLHRRVTILKQTPTQDQIPMRSVTERVMIYGVHECERSTDAVSGGAG